MKCKLEILDGKCTNGKKYCKFLRGNIYHSCDLQNLLNEIYSDTRGVARRNKMLEEILEKN